MNVKVGQYWVPKRGEHNLSPITIEEVVKYRRGGTVAYCVTEKGSRSFKPLNRIEARYELKERSNQPDNEPDSEPKPSNSNNETFVTPKEGQVWMRKANAQPVKRAHDVLILRVTEAHEAIDGRARVLIHRLTDRPLKDVPVLTSHLFKNYYLAYNSLSAYKDASAKKSAGEEVFTEPSEESDNIYVSPEMAATFADSFREATEEVMHAAAESFLEEMRQSLSSAFTDAMDEALNRAVSKAIAEAMAPYHEALSSLIGED